ncbi:trypsin-like peptidase domain-containing protein [Akkermansiaceae bacterium]|nr:trypsin-like peptidase domain-containing protein [Akkermansiaceae bacterium]
MKKPSTLLFALLASLSLTGSALYAQSPEDSAKPAKIESAPDVKDFQSLQKLNQQIVALSKKAQPATVCLIAKNGRGAGSGVVVSEDGLILTAAHVTSSMQEGITVIFPDGTRKSGKALGADYDRDAAMVQINEPGNYPFVEIGQSKDLKRNQWTVALGHSGGFDPMRKPPVRLGRVLANQNFIVSDTAVIGGDSGGPLFDTRGNVIGIHSNIGRTLMENRHVPIEVYRQQWESLKEGKLSGKRFNTAQQDAPSPDRPVLGVQLADGDDGVRVTEVVPNSPAERAGLQVDDVIKKINGTAVKSIGEFTNIVKGMKAGDEVKISYHQEESFRSAKVKLASYGELSAKAAAPEKKAEPKEEPKKERKKGKRKKPARKKDEPSKADKEAPKKSEPKKEAAPKKEDAKKRLEKAIADLLKNAAKNGGRLEVTPELIEKFGGMEKFMEELQKQGGMSPFPPQGPDTFFESSLKALAPVAKKNEGSTALITIDDKMVALGTVISANGQILTKNTETQKGELSVHLGEEKYVAKVLQRFPERDLALLKIDAKELHPVRFQTTEPPLGSILTATGAKSEPLGIGLLSVPGRAMAKVGFIGIMAGQSDQGVLIEKLVPKGAAAEAGLKEKDVITNLNGKKVADPIDFGHLIRGRKAGEILKVEYLREGKAGKATVTLKERAMRDNVKNDPRMKQSLGALSEKTSGFPDAIQHDIPLPPQLCGGPLLDLTGQCIGINVSRAGRTKTYAIPADEIQAMLESVKAPHKPVAKNDKADKSEAIKAIRQSLKEIEKRLEELEKAEK